MVYHFMEPRKGDEAVNMVISIKVTLTLWKISMYNIRCGMRLKLFINFFCGQKFYPGHGPWDRWKDTALTIAFQHLQQFFNILYIDRGFQLNIFCSFSFSYGMQENAVTVSLRSNTWQKRPTWMALVFSCWLERSLMALISLFIALGLSQLTKLSLGRTSALFSLLFTIRLGGTLNPGFELTDEMKRRCWK